MQISIVVFVLGGILALAAVITAVFAVWLVASEGRVASFPTPDFTCFSVQGIPAQLSQKRCLLLGKNIAHLELLTQDGSLLAFRAAPQGSGLHLADFGDYYRVDSQMYLFGVRVRRRFNAQESLFLWEKQGFCFALYAAQAQTQQLQQAVQQLVRTVQIV